MEKLNPSIEPRVVKLCGKSVLFELRPNEYAYATKRVANDILTGCKEIYYEEVEVPGKGMLGPNRMVWLLTPSRF